MPRPLLEKENTCAGRRVQWAMKREIKLPVEIKSEQVRASFKDGILEVHLPKLVIINAKRVQVD